MADTNIDNYWLSDKHEQEQLERILEFSKQTVESDKEYKKNCDDDTKTAKQLSKEMDKLDNVLRAQYESDMELVTQLSLQEQQGEQKAFSKSLANESNNDFDEKHGDGDNNDFDRLSEPRNVTLSSPGLQNIQGYVFCDGSFASHTGITETYPGYFESCVRGALCSLIALFMMNRGFFAELGIKSPYALVSHLETKGLGIGFGDNKLLESEDLNKIARALGVRFAINTEINGNPYDHWEIIGDDEAIELRPIVCDMGKRHYVIPGIV